MFRERGAILRNFSGQINTSPADNLDTHCPRWNYKNFKIIKVHNTDKHEITVL